MRLLSAKVYNTEMRRVTTALVSEQGGRKKDTCGTMSIPLNSSEKYCRLGKLPAICVHFFFFGLEAELHAPVAYG